MVLKLSRHQRVRLVRLLEYEPRYPRRMGESTGAPLTPEQRERMQRAILAELRRISDEAIAAGVPPATIARVIEERRRALDSSVETEEPSPDGQ